MEKSKPWGLQWRSSTVFILGTVAISMFTDLFLYGLVIPVLPFLLMQRLHIPMDQIQTQVAILLAVFASASVIFSPIAGVIADRVSARQIPFLAGLFAMLISTIIFALGQNMAVLIVARVFQGISATVVWTVGLALVMDTVGSGNLGKTVGSVGCGIEELSSSPLNLASRFLVSFLLANWPHRCSEGSCMKKPGSAVFLASVLPFS